jgi:hypothetical protein
MIIREAQKVRTADPAGYAWAVLRKFQNVDLVARRLIELHSIPSKHHDAARKQAQQLRYCLIQAREYFAAAAVVSTATKPNLLYYGAMSLALAEILFKQSGDSSLDRARNENRHHGLTMTVGSVKKGGDLQAVADAIRARPHEVQGIRHGTFELWHRTSREHPLCGNVTAHLQSGGSHLLFRVIFQAIDSVYPAIPSVGITLAECIKSIPHMMESLYRTSIPSNLVRGKSSSEVWQGPHWQAQQTFIFHPNSQHPKYLELILADPNSVDRITIHEVGNAATIILNADWVNGAVRMPMPPAATITTEEWRMWMNSPSLNEFGYLYVAIYLAGNYARYYPDKWLLDVETSAALSLVIEELCALCEWRMPWLAMCELDQILYVPEA